MNEKVTQVLGTCLGLILVPVLIAVGMSMSKKHDEQFPWKASVFYKESGDIIDSKDVKTLDECRNWSNEKIGDSEKDSRDYSCGTGCTFADNTIAGGKRVNIYTCSETTK